METTTSKLQEKIDNAIERNKVDVSNNFNKFNVTVGNLNDAIISINGTRPTISTIYAGTNEDIVKSSLIFNYPEVKDENGFISIPDFKFIHPHALVQMASKFKIPTAYIQSLCNGNDWQKTLCAQNLNEHMKYTNRAKVLIRNVGNEMRAFLSDSYKRINSTEIMTNFLRGVKNNNMVVYDFHYADTKFYVEAVDREVVMIDTPNNGTVGMVFGLRLKNSDFGDGALELSSYFLQVICLNGMTRQNAMRNIHLGAKLNDDISYSQKTYDLNTQASVSAMNDCIWHLVSPDYRHKQIMSITRASEITIEPESALKKLPAMGVLKEEIKEIGDLLMASKIDDGLQGTATLWKFANAVNASGREKSALRKRDLEEVSGKLLESVWID